MANIRYVYDTLPRVAELGYQELPFVHSSTLVISRDAPDYAEQVAEFFKAPPKVPYIRSTPEGEPFKNILVDYLAKKIIDEETAIKPFPSYRALSYSEYRFLDVYRKNPIARTSLG